MIQRTKTLSNVRQNTLPDTKTLSNVRQNTLYKRNPEKGFFYRFGGQMIEKTVYIGKQDFYDVIRSNGGIWTDSKERPILCVTKSLEHDSLYWAIPMGDLSHRKNEAQQRIHVYLAKDSTNIESCYYHLGTTNKQSLFFISDIVPITDK